MSKKDFSERFGELSKGIDDITNSHCNSLDHISEVATDNSLAINQDIIKITAEINMYKNQAAESFIQIGRRLSKAKEILPHGEFLHWLKNSVDFSERTARNFMRVASEYSNWNAHSDLNYSKLLTLLQVPADERDEFISQDYEVNGQTKSVEKMSLRELEKVVKKSKEEKIVEVKSNHCVNTDDTVQAIDVFKSSLDNACCNFFRMVNGSSGEKHEKAMQECVDYLCEAIEKFENLEKS